MLYHVIEFMEFPFSLSYLVGATIIMVRREVECYQREGQAREGVSQEWG